MPSLIDSLLDILKCRYKGINEELEWRCVYFISTLVITVYYSSYEILVKEMGFTFSVVFLTITTLIALSALIKSLTEKKKKKYIIEAGDFKWVVTRFSNNVVRVNETPLCKIHEMPLATHRQDTYYCCECDESIKLKWEELSEMHQIASNKAEADVNNSLKLKKRYIPV